MSKEMDAGTPLRILHLEDSPLDAEIIRERLIDAGFSMHVDWAADERQFSAFLQRGGYDLILADYLLPGFDAPAALLLTRSFCPDIPFIAVSGAIGEENAVELLKLGATDYVLKDNLVKLPLAMTRALDEAREQKARRLAEHALHRLNRELQAISSCNQALMRAVDEQTLLDGICRIVCEKAGYRMAWVGYAENDEAKSIRPVAWGGVVDGGYLEEISLTWSDTERGQGPAGTAIRSGKPSYGQNFATDPQLAPWREFALRRGFRSAIAFPLKDEYATAFGVLVIYSAQANAFTPDEIRLLEELSGDLAFGIGALRDRAARNRHEAELFRREQMFRALAENSPDLIARYDLDGRRLYVNPAWQKASGIPAHKVIGKAAVHLFTFPEPNDYQAKVLAAALGDGSEFEATIESPTLGSRAYHMRVVPERGADGQVQSILTIGCDITALVEAERRLEDSQAQLRELAMHLEAAREEERSRIARELHDEMGQQLAGLRLGVNLLGLDFGKDEPRLSQRCAKLRDLVDKTIQIARDVSSSLRPAALDMGIVPALEWLTMEFSRNTGIPCGLMAGQGDIHVGEDQAVAIFRIAQESLTNAARHANAEQVDIMFQCEDETLGIEIRDNGVGFDTAGPRKEKSFGLVGIRERALAVGGSVTIFSSPDTGTAVQVRIPKGQARDGE